MRSLVFEGDTWQVYDLWSRRISQKDRLIYKFDDDYIYIFAIGGHYE
ncbi:MAG: type II toxin-antitoxin system YoeB family toxin [Cyanobacteria bacterium J06636_16]